MIEEPLKRVAELIVSNIDKKSADGESSIRLCNYVDVYYNDLISADLPFMEATASKDQIRRFGLRSGDVLFTKDSETADDIAVPAYVPKTLPGVVSGYHLAIARPRAGRIDGAFLYWALASLRSRRQFAVAATGVTRFGLRHESMGEVLVPVPSMSEQHAIADYLDAETSRIDALIAKKRRLVGLLEERVESLVRWRIGESALADPASVASTMPIRRALVKLSRPALTGGEMITAFRDGQVTARSLRRKDGYTESWIDASRVQGVRVDDVVVHGLDGFAGAIGTSEADGVCSPIYHVCVPAEGGDALYQGRLLRILAVSGYLGNFASSTRERAVDFRNWDLFGRIPIPDVDPAEQREVGNLIRSIRPLRSAVERSANLAHEYRQALITAAVTGELEIPGFAA